MRNLKRLLALMLTVLMVAGCFAIPTSAKSFDDVDEYVDAIDLLSAIKVAQGRTDTEFKPDLDVKRYEAALFFARALTGKTNDEVWKTGTNNTAFKDLGENSFINAISYCSNNAIITGKTTTKYDPDGGVTIEQLYTMAIRALGYETATMKASLGDGLWAYIDKAITLGLDAGLEKITNYKKVANRGETAQIIYNLLFTETADGYTYAEKSFDLSIETLVLAATDTQKYDIAARDAEYNVAIAATDYIGLAPIDAKGNLGKVFYISEADFMAALGVDKYDFNAKLGYSFKTIADTTLTNIYSIEENASKKFENAPGATAFSITKDTTKITADNVTYVAVEEYKNKLWNVGVKNYATGTNEVLFYDWSKAETTVGDGFYYYDANGNITDKNGNILMYLMSNVAANPFAGAATKLYMVKDVNNTYRLPTAEDWAKATNYVQGQAANYYKQVWTNFGADYANKNLYSELVAIDDNGDTYYDRMFYTKYSFGKFATNSDGSATIATANGATAATLAKGYTVVGTVASGDYIIYAYNQKLNELIVKSKVEAKVGYVNGFSVIGANSSVITIEGAPLGIDNIAIDGVISLNNVLGANVTDGYIKATDDLIGRYVTYYQIDKTVVAFANADVSDYVVFDGIVTVTAENAIAAKAYLTGSTNATLINIASLNGYPLSANALGGFNSTLSYVYSTLLGMNRGTILTFVKDAKDQYHLYEIQGQDDMKIDGALIAKSELLAKGTANGNAITFDTDAFSSIAYAGAEPLFQVNAATKFIFVDKDANGNYGVKGVFTGKPADDSKIDFNKGQVLIKKGDNALVSYVYAIDTAYDKSFEEVKYSSVVYIDKAYTTLTNSFANQYNGTEWAYAKAIDVATGKFVNVKSASTRLLAGNFYVVKNEYAIEKITPAKVKIEAIEHNATFGVLTNKVTVNGVTDAQMLGSIIAFKDADTIETKDNKGAEVLSYNTLAFAKEIADLDDYANAYLIKTTVDGVEKYNFVLLNPYMGSHEDDKEAADATTLAADKAILDLVKAKLTLEQTKTGTGEAAKAVVGGITFKYTPATSTDAATQAKIDATKFAVSYTRPTTVNVVQSPLAYGDSPEGGWVLNVKEAQDHTYLATGNVGDKFKVTVTLKYGTATETIACEVAVNTEAAEALAAWKADLDEASSITYKTATNTVEIVVNDVAVAAGMSLKVVDAPAGGNVCINAATATKDGKITLTTTSTATAPKVFTFSAVGTYKLALVADYSADKKDVVITEIEVEVLNKSK